MTIRDDIKVLEVDYPNSDPKLYSRLAHAEFDANRDLTLFAAVAIILAFVALFGGFFIGQQMVLQTFAHHGVNLTFYYTPQF